MMLPHEQCQFFPAEGEAACSSRRATAARRAAARRMRYEYAGRQRLPRSEMRFQGDKAHAQPRISTVT